MNWLRNKFGDKLPARPQSWSDVVRNMNRNLLILTSVLALFISCATKSDSLEITGTWVLNNLENKSINIYGVEDDIMNQAKLKFRADNLVEINNPDQKITWTLDYKIVRDTVVQLIVNYTSFITDTTTMVFIGTDELMPGYRVKKLTQDSLVLITRYKKAWLELPEPNEFGTKPDLLEEHEIILMRE